MKKWCLILLGVALAAAVTRLACLARDEDAGTVYRGKPLSAWMRSAVTEGDRDALTIMGFAIPAEDAAAKARIGKELRSYAVHALTTEDNRFWKPYTALRAKLPAPLANWFPEWREPKKVRWSAATWVCDTSGVVQSPATVLTECVRKDSGPQMQRMVSWALASYGLTRPDDYQLMFAALTDSNPRIRQAALKWFSLTKCSPETVVPVFVAGLEDDAMRSDYAEALRAYGPQAQFMVPTLVAFSKANNRATASVASWALVGIEPEGAGRHFRAQGMK